MHSYEEYGVDEEMFLDAWALLQGHRGDYKWVERDDFDMSDEEGSDDPVE